MLQMITLTPANCVQILFRIKAYFDLNLVPVSVLDKHYKYTNAVK